MGILLVAIGGALGAAARYLLAGWVGARAASAFPWATFLINVTGSFLIGIVLGLLAAGRISGEARLFLTVGVLGGYTTFSTFSYETFQLLNGGRLVPALLYALGQVLLGVVAVYLGLVLARALGGA